MAEPIPKMITDILIVVLLDLGQSQTQDKWQDNEMYASPHVPNYNKNNKVWIP